MADADAGADEQYIMHAHLFDGNLERRGRERFTHDDGSMFDASK